MGFVSNALRYFVVLAVVLGLSAVLSANGPTGLASVLKLIGVGILMNGAVFLLARWARRRWQAGRVRTNIPKPSEGAA